MLQRIYGTAWNAQEELDAYLANQIEEAAETRPPQDPAWLLLSSGAACVLGRGDCRLRGRRSAFPVCCLLLLFKAC